MLYQLSYASAESRPRDYTQPTPPSNRLGANSCGVERS